MNKLDIDIAEAIGEISKVATLINLQGKHTVFVNDMGHVQTLEIGFHKNGWGNGKDPNLSQNIRYKAKYEPLKALRKVSDDLYKILKNGQVSLKERDYDIEEIRHYKFY